MANIQPDTAEHKLYIVDTLEPNHQQAVYLRFGGTDYIDIARECEVIYSTVRHWFAKNGVCYAALKQLNDERSRENRARFKKLDKKIEEYAPDALETLHQRAKVSWKAAESLLHIAGKVPVQKIKAEVENKESDNKIKESAKQIADYVRQNLAGGNQKNT